MAISNFLLRDNKVDDGSKPNKIILHWTGGSEKANSDDMQHYHFIVQQDSSIVYGKHLMRANDNTADGVYAAHTYRCNTRAIGVSMAGMAGSRERPFDPGVAPITHGQYETTCRVIAELCYRKKIPVTPTTTLNHGEVQKNLAIRQRNKWDVMVLPWNQSLNWDQVGEHFRTRLAYYLAAYENMGSATAPEQPEAPASDEDAGVTTGTERRGRVIASRGLNIRVLPSTNALKAGNALPKGRIVEILAIDESVPLKPWYYVTSNGVSGWVYGKFVQLFGEDNNLNDGAVG